MQRVWGLVKTKWTCHTCVHVLLCLQARVFVRRVHVCFSIHSVFFSGVCVVRIFFFSGVSRGPYCTFLYTLILLCACVCVQLSLIWCDCVWHVVCAGAVNRRVPNRDSSLLFSPIPGMFHPSEGLSMDKVFAYGLTNAQTRIQTHAHTLVWDTNKSKRDVWRIHSCECKMCSYIHTSGPFWISS